MGHKNLAGAARITYGGVINEVMLQTRHFNYLALQCGDLSDLRHDKVNWAAAYRRRLLEDFESIKVALPGTCSRVLDVGSGLGGLDILIKRYYGWGRGGTKVTLLDGRDDNVEGLEGAEDHDATFNSEEVTRNFWGLNGEQLDDYVPADGLPTGIEYRYDLILSTRSWCFHYEPARYLDWVVERTRSGAPLVVDLRLGRSEWVHQLEEHFILIGILKPYAKCERTWWRRR